MPHNKLYEIWNQVPPAYYQRGVSSNLFQRVWHGNKIKHAARILQSLEFKSVLDVGCASGYMLSEIARAFPRATYHGLDAYDKSIAYAKKKYPAIKFTVANAEKLPFKRRSFDVVISYETIEHIEHPERALREMKRVLKKNGTLILAMDSGNAAFRIIWHLWENTYGRVWKNAHLHPFHHSELEALVRRVGFKEVSKRFTHMGLEVVFILR